MNIGIASALPTMVQAWQHAVGLAPGHEVAWVARSGVEAVEACLRQKPDLLVMDLDMPDIDGVEATQRIMARTPCAILIVTSAVGANVSRVFEAMGQGALDAVDAAVLQSGDRQLSVAPLVAKIAAISRLLRNRSATAQDLSCIPTAIRRSDVLVGIGASAGGPAALAAVLAALPGDFSAAVVIVQHVGEQFALGMAEWLARSSALPVRVAKEGDSPSPGTVLLAGTCEHLTLTGPSQLGYVPEPRDYVYRPSVDVFFYSITNLWRGSAIGVLLTGMGRDGALGLKALRAKGHYTLAQDRASSAVYGMPKAAAALGAAVDIVPLRRIADQLVDAVARTSEAKNPR